MAAILWLLVLTVLSQGCRSSLPGQTQVGCKIWKAKGDNVCCDECHKGNRLVKACGPNPKDLCKPCESGTFTLDPRSYRCSRCTQCVGAQIHLKDCTVQSDTQCGCKDGLVCADKECSYCVQKCDKGSERSSVDSCRPCPKGTFNDKSFGKCQAWSTRCPHPNQVIVAKGTESSDIQCVEKCDKGYELLDDESCRPCPNGTFNDKSLEKCKAWSTRCPYPNQVIVTKGTESSDIQCVTISSVNKPNPPGPRDMDQWRPTVVYEVVMATLMVLFIVAIVIIVFAAVKINQKRNKPEKKPTKTPIIRNPTDEPRTLIAIECSFHEAQQEQGSSTESLIKEPSEELSV